MTIVPLKHLCVAINRGAAPTYADDGAGEAVAVGQSCQRPSGRFDLTFGRAHTGPVAQKGRLHGGEVLINSTGTGTLGRSALVRAIPLGLTVFVDTHVTLLRFDATMADPRFMAYYFGLPTTRRYVEDALSVGATKQRELDIVPLRAHRLDIPGLEEQVAAADFLDRECARIDRLAVRQTGEGESMLGALGGLLIEYRDALITEAVTGRPSRNEIDNSNAADVGQHLREIAMPPTPLP